MKFEIEAKDIMKMVVEQLQFAVMAREVVELFLAEHYPTKIIARFDELREKHSKNRGDRWYVERYETALKSYREARQERAKAAGSGSPVELMLLDFAEAEAAVELADNLRSLYEEIDDRWTDDSKALVPNAMRSRLYSAAPRGRDY